MEEEEKSSRLSNLSSFIRDRFRCPGKIFGLDSRLKNIENQINSLIYKKLKEEKLKEMCENDGDDQARRIEEQYRMIDEEERMLKKQMKRNGSMVNIRETVHANNPRTRKHSQKVIRATRLQDSYQIVKIKMEKKMERIKGVKVKGKHGGKRGRSKGRKTAKSRNRLKSKTRKKILEMNKLGNVDFCPQRKSHKSIKGVKKSRKLKSKKS